MPTDDTYSIASGANLWAGRGAPMRFAEVPEIVFVRGYADTEHLGIFHIDTANRWAPGDLTNADGWAPNVATELAVLSGSMPAGLSYSSATGVLTYDGSEPTGATRSVTVKLRTTDLAAESAEFRVRILRPTLVWGTDATTDATVAANFGGVPKYDPADGGASGFRSATFAELSGSATDSAPNVMVFMPGEYEAFDDGYTPPSTSIVGGRLFLVDDRQYLYMIGLPGARPIIRGNALDRKWSSNKNRLTYFKNLDFVDFNIGEGSFSAGEEDLADRVSYITQVTARGSTTDNNWYGTDNREGADGGWAWDTNSVSTWFWRCNTVACGGLDATHMMYIEGRANSELQINCCEFLGGRRNNTSKSTRWLKKIRNTYLSAFQDPESPTTGQRTAELIDWVGCGVGVIYNNHLFSGYTAANGGQQAGLLRKRQRRDWWGSDTPSYPDQGFSPPTTSNAHGGYSAPPGFGSGPDTYIDPEFWAAVSAKEISDPTNPYTFPYYVAFNVFEWYEEGSGRKAWFRDDGTYPVQATAQFATSEILGTAPEGWVERSANFLLNNTLIGWQAGDTSDPTRYVNLSDDFNISTDSGASVTNPGTFDPELGIWVNGPGPYINPPPSRTIHYNQGLVVPWDGASAFAAVPSWFML